MIEVELIGGPYDGHTFRMANGIAKEWNADKAVLPIDGGTAVYRGRRGTLASPVRMDFVQPMTLLPANRR